MGSLRVNAAKILIDAGIQEQAGSGLAKPAGQFPIDFRSLRTTRLRTEARCARCARWVGVVAS